MDIRQSTSQAALLDVFRSGRCRTGDSIAEFELVAAWARTGLRWSDLQVALDDLTHRGLLAMRADDEQQRVVLTRAGCRAIEARQGEWLLRLTDWCHLQWLRLDAWTPVQPQPRRGSWLMVVAVVVTALLTLTSRAGQPQIPAPNTLCAMTRSGTCAGAQARGAPCPVSASDESEAAFLQWAVAMRRAVDSDAAVRALGPRDTGLRGPCRANQEARLLTPALTP